IVVRNALQRLTGFSPCRQTTFDDKSVEAAISKLQRHPGAGRFAYSSTVKINVLVPGNVLQFFHQVIGLEPHGSLDARRGRIVVTMTAHIHDQDVTAVVRCQLLGQILDLYAGNYAINLVLAIQPDTVADVDNGRDEKNLSESMTGGLKSASNGGKEIMKQVTDRSISRDVETNSNDCQPKKNEQRH